MQQITPLQYIKIAVANSFGHDKMTWNDRISWFNDNNGKFGKLIQDADEPILMQKALHAYSDAINDKPTGFLIGLDATASGLQFMSCLIGCKKTAASVNLVDTGKREDVYAVVANEMNKSRNEVKPALMTYFYGSRKQPEAVFGEGVQKFYEALDVRLPGAVECMQDMQSCWQSGALAHTWTLPDGHTAHVKVMEGVNKRIEIDEMDHATFTHRSYINQGADSGLSLAANIVHSIDGYVVREMYRMAEAQGFELLTIHDSFWCSPNYAQNIRENYVRILADIADSSLMQDILREVTNDPTLVYKKVGSSLSSSILQSEYALS